MEYTCITEENKVIFPVCVWSLLEYPQCSSILEGETKGPSRGLVDLWKGTREPYLAGRDGGALCEIVWRARGGKEWRCGC